MKIGFFVHRYHPVRGGAERFIQKTAEFCVLQNDEVTVHSTNADNLQSFICRHSKKLRCGEDNINGVKIIRHKIKYLFLRKYWGKLLFEIPVLNGYFRGYIHPATPIVPSMRKIKPDYDLIVSTAIPYDYINISAFFLSKKFNIPFVFVPFLHLGDLNNPNDPVRRFYTQKYQINLMKNADGIIVQTEIEKIFLGGQGVDKNKIMKIGQGIDIKSFSKKNPAILRKKLNIPEKAFVIGHLANLSFEKGSIDLLEAFEKLSNEKKDIYLIYAGASVDSYKQFVSSIHIPYNFRELGIIDDQTRNEFFSAIDCFCLPSRVESFGVVFLESWRFEKPVIGYNAGGIPDVISSNIDGLLAGAGNKDELIQKILLLYNNNNLKDKLGKAGKTKVEKFFTLDIINKKTYSFLKKTAKPVD